MDIPSVKPYFKEEDISAISEEVRSILQTGRLILGPYTEKFEASFSEYCGVKYAVAVSSCTAALEICMRYFEIERKEVIVPTNTFIATGNAVIYNGGTLVLADIKADTLCLDPDELLKRITDKTKGVILVHLAGLPCPYVELIQSICKEKGLFLIEDAAHAHGATIDGRKTGSFGDAGCFSFYPTKVMTTCTGGMITTNDSKLAEYAESLRHYGVGKGLHHIINMGYDWLMDEISALLGTYQLKALNSNLTRRNEIAQIYGNGLAGIDGVSIYQVPHNIRHSYYKYPMLLNNKYNKKTFVEQMQIQKGISIGSIYDPPCHLQPVYQRLYGFHEGMFPIAEATLKQTCSLPMYPQMTDIEVEYVLKSLKELLPGCKETAVLAGSHLCDAK